MPDGKMLNPDGAQKFGATSPGLKRTVNVLPNIWPNVSVKPGPIVIVYSFAGSNAAGSRSTYCDVSYICTRLAQGLGVGLMLMAAVAESTVTPLSNSRRGSPPSKRGSSL